MHNTTMINDGNSKSYKWNESYGCSNYLFEEEVKLKSVV